MTESYKLLEYKQHPPDQTNTFLIQQEPAGTPEELMNGITAVRPGGGYVPSFNLFRRNNALFLDKVQVNGQDQEPMYAWLKVTLTQTEKIVETINFLLSSLRAHTRIQAFYRGTCTIMTRQMWMIFDGISKNFSSTKTDFHTWGREIFWDERALNISWKTSVLGLMQQRCLHRRIW